MKLTSNQIAVIGALALVLCLPLVSIGAKAASDVDAYNATVCNPVLTNSSLIPVLTASSGVYAIHKDSYTCPTPPPAAMAQTDFLVFFDWDKTAITPAARKILSDAAAAAQSMKTVRIDVTGHTDTSGSPRYNQALSERRAAAVKQELVLRGINPAMITTVGKGETELMVPTRDGIREPTNRRAQIVIVTN